MASEQFIIPGEEPEIYTDDSESSVDSIKELMVNRTTKKTPSSPGTTVTTPANESSSPKKESTQKKSPKSDKGDISPKPKKPKVKKDLEKSEVPKPKKEKKPKNKAPKESNSSNEGVAKEGEKEKPAKPPKSPKTNPTPTPAPSLETVGEKEVAETPKKTKPKVPKSPKSPKLGSSQDSDKQAPKHEVKSEEPKTEKTEPTQKPKSPKRKKPEKEETKKEPEKEGEHKPKKPKRSKTKAPKEPAKEVTMEPKEDKVDVPSKVEEEPTETPKKDPESSKKHDLARTLQGFRLSNDAVFSSLSTGIDDIPLGSLKAKMLTASSSSDSITSSSSEEDSDSDEDSKDVFIKPKVPPYQPGAEESDDEEDDDDDEEEEDEDEEEEEVTPKAKPSSLTETPKSSGEQFINKERLQTSFRSPVDIPQGCEIYCGNLPVNISEEELRELFEECGVITRINKLNKKGIAFITFSNEESAQKASEYNNSPYKGQLLNINITTSRPGKKESGKFSRGGSFQPKDDREPMVSNEVCVRNLNFNSTEEGLRELFSECGQVTRCYLPKFHDSGKPMGICFISFTTVEAAKRAVEYDQTEIDGRTVSIQFAQPRGNRASGRGRPLKGRFTTGSSRISTLNRSFSNNSNHSNGSFKDGKASKNGFVKAGEEFKKVGAVGEETKPKSIIFEDSDSE